MASSALVLSPWGGVAFSEHKHALRKMQGCQRMPARAYAPRADLNFTMKFGAKRRAAVPVSASASEPTSSGTLSLDETYATAAGPYNDCHFPFTLSLRTVLFTGKRGPSDTHATPK